eukprot:gnl/MRDRNA2_/MRDRNA2_113440_c0_seq1.p1 gnl/MRDRNA2_/MRDRNA2_113440_c0~~gnl/MRDRNA2_/MRDRNA2_113440_c0_seq1.p1  ORF type:complete len:430 (-),score=61.66 gnl/MRDRNA2_/MRDRNA2_113440_c0_seq1:14-1303(-)
MVLDESLRDFLARCRQDWGHADLRSVQRKLHTVGITDVNSLLKAVKDGSLNIKLEAFGERTFTSQTLAIFRAECDSQHSARPNPSSNPEPSVDAFLTEARQRAQSQEVPGVTKLFRTELLTGASASSAPIDAPQNPSDDSKGSKGFKMSGSGTERLQQQEDAPNFGHNPFNTREDRDPLYPNGLHPNTTDEQELRDPLYREMRRTIQTLDRAADNARRRNAKLQSGLSEAQAGLERIQESLRRSRVHPEMKQGPPRSMPSTRAHASTSSTSSASSMPQPQPSAEYPGPRGTRNDYAGPRNSRNASKRSPSAPPGSSMPPHGRPGAQGASPSAHPGNSTPPRCNRGSQRGFTFGDGRSVKQPNQNLSPACSALDAVRTEMRAARSKSVVERREKLRELQLRWHPDKNPSSEAEATAVFQLIQSEKGLLGL